jgi:hypothetical protein
VLRFASHSSRPSLSLVVDHDDAEREFEYRAGAEKVLEAAEANSWAVVSFRNDWRTVFRDPAEG